LQELGGAAVSISKTYPGSGRPEKEDLMPDPHSIPNQFGSISALLAEFDDICGTRPPRKGPPKPHLLKDVLISAAIHNLAGKISDSKSRDQLQGLANQVYTNASKSISG
jgi:hypothetical protein